MTVQKSLLPLGVLKSLKGARKTVCNFSKHSEAIERFIEGADKITNEITTSEISLQEKVRKILVEALESDNQVIKVRAAAALYRPIC